MAQRVNRSSLGLYLLGMVALPKMTSARVSVISSGKTARRRRWTRRLPLLGLGLVVFASGCTATSSSQSLVPPLTGADGSQGEMASGIQILALLTALAFIPAMLMMASSFTRIVIVLSFIRNALGVPQTPPNPVLLGLALFLSIFVMAPVWQGINSASLQPYLNKQITQDEALQRGVEPMRDFMLRQTREKDLSLFIYLAKLPRPKNESEVPTHVLIPAFVISEIKTAFQMGFLILVPFLIIDMVVSSTLMSMGMVMLPPAVISLPFKVLLFVLVDGWHLVIRSVMVSFA